MFALFGKNLEKAVLEALSGVMDPDLHKDIVSLGFIQNLKTEGGEVGFDLVLTTPACPVKEDLKAQCTQRVQALSGVKSVAIELKSAPRRSPLAEQAAETLRDVRSIIAVSSCKGGVGKSTVAANLAVSLARSGAAVGLLDADIYGPSQPTLFGLAEKKPWVEDQRFVPLEGCGVRMMSAGYLFPPGEAAVLRGPMVSNVLQQILLKTRWGGLDYLVLDMPPGTGDIQITVCQALRLTGAVIVSTPQKISLLDVGKGIAMFDKVKVPILGIVENMSEFICDGCDKHHAIFGPSGVPRLAEIYGIPVLGRIPFSPRIVTESDRGRPPAFADGTPEGAAFRELATAVVRAAAKATASEADLPVVDIAW